MVFQRRTGMKRLTTTHRHYLFLMYLHSPPPLDARLMAARSLFPYCAPSLLRHAHFSAPSHTAIGYLQQISPWPHADSRPHGRIHARRVMASRRHAVTALVDCLFMTTAHRAYSRRMLHLSRPEKRLFQDMSP